MQDTIAKMLPTWTTDPQFENLRAVQAFKIVSVALSDDNVDELQAWLATQHGTVQAFDNSLSNTHRRFTYRSAGKDRLRLVWQQEVSTTPLQPYSNAYAYVPDCDETDPSCQTETCGYFTDCETQSFDGSPYIAEVSAQEAEVNAILASIGLDPITIDGGGEPLLMMAKCDTERVAVRGTALLFAYYGGKTVVMAAVFKSPMGTLAALEGAAASLVAVNIAHHAYRTCMES